MAHDDGAPRRPPPPRPDPIHQRVIDFDLTTANEPDSDEVQEPVRGNWPMWFLLIAFVVLAAAVWMVARIPLEPVPIPSPQLPPGAEDVGHPLDGN